MTRIAIVEKLKCQNKVNCPFICGGVCPVNRSGKECIIVGEDNKPIINEELCIGCGICVRKCPFDALKIINLPEAWDKAPIHRYGRNGFHLYSLPIPMFGKVVGIVGKNGIGKSTAVKILSGMLKPNLGKDSDASYDDVIQYFKGTEAQAYFEKVKEGKIKVAYKPQAVDLIPKQFKGKVRELLQNVDEKGEFDTIVKELELEKFLDTNVQEISGGELQRVAIAATVLKKADVYFFDEPTSYLDIKQRLKVSNFIRKLATPYVAVVVIEHDLIILDYMTDLVHLMYGKEAGYGIVSQPKTTRVGINIYLSGFLRDENIRFRDTEIRFAARPPEEAKHIHTLTSWKGIAKKLGNFSLEAPEGVIYTKDVVGVVGENGIGKTSFVKILADVVEPDSGSVENKVVVSYKPQYIDIGDSDELVSSVLAEALERYKSQLIQPLEIERLLLRKVGELSGGELQRVAIALCLSKKADLYLLDEPSAYLDVEQRLVVSKVIRDVMELRGTSAIVVDHDLLFVDYLSHKILVFEGEPAVKGKALGPFGMKEGMSRFLKDLGITFRRDEESLRPRANKPGSVKDREQRSTGNYYYII
ncbi:ribosome biogenesis/translation initiation ATPase RLI [Candidatus Woesearchaeota archaeon]|nr:ribosome biogenesis/translation initiation ATPase RLI [Candidatus Woesearchaeota archaeon]